MKDTKNTIEKELENDKDYNQWKQWRRKQHRNNCGGRRYYGGGCGAVYGLGFIGALIFFIGHATTFWTGVLGFFQALVWPAFLVYESLKLLIK